MKLVKIVALVAVFFTGFAMAGLEQLAAVLPPCGVCLKSWLAWGSQTDYFTAEVPGGRHRKIHLRHDRSGLYMHKSRSQCECEYVCGTQLHDQGIPQYVLLVFVGSLSLDL